ncbi:MAG: beta-L-arabinofuranosidase domain-containing protein [Pseudomonadota bacterium]
MNDDLRTRREAIKLLGAGATTAALTCTPVAADTDIFAGHAPPKYFPLADVRLGAGPFLDAQRRDADYLLQLEPDRMLHNFRKNAGLDPKAQVYGGWESVEPWIEIRCHGHTLGHYLTASACMYASTGDTRFGERVDYIVGELAAAQAKTGGWLTAFPDGVAPLLDSVAGKPFAGVPWYTTHKVMAGLRDAHVIRGNPQALAVLVKFADWIDTATADVPLAQFQKMLDREHGGMNEVCADLFELTQERRYLAMAHRFSHRALLNPLMQRRDTLDGLHANTQIPKVIGFSRIDEYAGAANFFWESVVAHRSFATGGHGDGEHFFPRHKFSEHLGSAKTMETCCTHNMLRLTRSLYEKGLSSSHFDFFERGLFNAILGSQDPESGMNTYFQATRPGYVKLYHTPFDSFWCCTGSGIENHARYGESIYARADDTLYVNLFVASTLTWRERGLTLIQETRFPDTDGTRLTFRVREPQKLTLSIRHPAWCEVMTVRVNGRKYLSRTPDSYFELPRKFRSGDVIEVQTPMTLRSEPLPGSPGHIAVMYGPIALAAKLGTAGLTPGSQLIINERESGQMLNETVAIPVWTRPLDQLPASLVRTAAASLTFSSTGFDGGAPVQFAPWFRLAHERYNLYWRREGVQG